MPKGKSKAADGGGDAGPSKKIKLEDAGKIDGCEVYWEWEGDKRIWTRYLPSINSQVCNAFNAGEKQLKFDIGSITMIAKFEAMVQKNAKTGWERRLRCAVKDDSDEEYYVWQWEDDKGIWNPYSAQVSVDLEKGRTSGETAVDIVASHRSYSVDIKNMDQTNTVTNVKRPVKREKSAAVIHVEAPITTSRSKVKEEPMDTEDTKASKSGGRGAKSGGASKSGSRRKSSAENGEGETKVKTVLLKGKAPVDPECEVMQGKAHVFSEGKDVWDCMLNQTNVSNNNNKYYLIQLLEEDTKKAYHVWQRWGRVGYNGQNNLVPCGTDLDKAKKIFTKKFTDKTKNDWSLRDKFEKVPGKYDLLKMDYNAKEAEEDETDAGPSSSVKEEVPDSKLDKRLQDLINLICDIKSMEEAVVEMKYDAKKAPLGKLTTDQIKAGYTALKTIDACITKNDFGPRLTRACDEFYTRIPHEFGMRQPPLIRTKEVVELKMQLLEALGDIEIAIKTLKKGDRSENPVDRHYHALKCELSPLDKSGDMFKLISDYLQNTHAATHNQYQMVIEGIFEMEKENEAKNFKDHGNRMLLWHGSRLTNWVGILSRGLRIAPPEAPVTGYMFGKGVYFADMSSKSANYCFATKAKSTGLLLLSEVSLGQTNDLLSADYKADKLPAGKHSVWGKGRIAPDPSMTKSLPDGTVLPLGKGKDTGVNNPNGYTLNYNEFIVYDTSQIKMRYLVQVKFKFR